MEVNIPFGGQDADAAPSHQQTYTPSNRPGRRAGAEVSITERSDGSQLVDYGSGFGPTSPAQSGRQASPAVTFRSPDGVSIMSRDAARDSLVVGADGEVISSLGALLNAGLITEQNGSYVLSGELAAQAPQQAQHQAQQQQERPSDPLAPEAPIRDNLSAKSEAILGHLEARHGDAYRLLEASLVGGKLPSNADLDAAAVQMGLNREEVSGLVNAAVKEFSQQATDAITAMVGDADQVLSWANSDPKGKKLFEAARRAQATERSLEGYAALSRGYILSLAETSPDTVAAGLRAGGTKASVEGGQVVIDLGNGMGTTTLGAAFNSGLATLSDSRKRRARK